MHSSISAIVFVLRLSRNSDRYDQIWLLIFAILKVFTYWCILFLTNQFLLNNCFKRCFKSFLSPFQCKRLLPQKAIAITSVPSPGQTKGRGTSQKWGALKLTKLLHIKTDLHILYGYKYKFKNSAFMSKKRSIRPATFLISFSSAAPNTVRQLERCSIGKISFRGGQKVLPFSTVQACWAISVAKIFD